MSKSAWFWIIFVIAILLYGVFDWPVSRRWGAVAIIFILLAIVGWAQFGPPVR